MQVTLIHEELWRWKKKNINPSHEEKKHLLSSHGNKVKLNYSE
jgi:hypothetical protein